MANITALIIGIDGWEEYTLPLIDSLKKHEPTAQIVVVDNASDEPYPRNRRNVHRTAMRLSYAAAINRAAKEAKDPDWYLVLSNDVLCTGPFGDILEGLKPCVAGPMQKQQYRHQYIEGWCVAVHAEVWQPWDEVYQMASWEDVDFCAAAVARGYELKNLPDFPFTHLDQGQRIKMPKFYETDHINRLEFLKRWGQ